MAKIVGIPDAIAFQVDEHGNVVAWGQLGFATHVQVIDKKARKRLEDGAPAIWSEEAGKIVVGEVPPPPPVILHLEGAEEVRLRELLAKVDYRRARQQAYGIRVPNGDQLALLWDLLQKQGATSDEEDDAAGEALRQIKRVKEDYPKPTPEEIEELRGFKKKFPHLFSDATQSPEAVP